MTPKDTISIECDFTSLEKRVANNTKSYVPYAGLHTLTGRTRIPPQPIAFPPTSRDLQNEDKTK